MSRRGGRRATQSGSAGSGAATLPVSWGMSSWDSSTTLATGVGGGVQGSAATGMGILLCFVANSIPTGTQFLFTNQVGNSGCTLSMTSAGVLRAVFGNGAATATAPTRTFTDADLGKIHIVVGNTDASSLTMLLNTAQIPGSTALAGYGVPGDRCYMATAGVPATAFTFLGLAGRDSPISVADLQTIYAATKAAGQLSLGGVSMDHAWISPQGPGASMVATLEDTIAADDMTFTAGSAANVEIVPVGRSWAA